MIRKYIEKIGENRNVEDMEKLGDMLSEIIYKTKESHPDIYKKYKVELYEMAYGKKLNEEIIELNEETKKRELEIKEIMHFLQISSGESAYLEYIFAWK